MEATSYEDGVSALRGVVLLTRTKHAVPKIEAPSLQGGWNPCVNGWFSLLAYQRGSVEKRGSSLRRMVSRLAGGVVYGDHPTSGPKVSLNPPPPKIISNTPRTHGLKTIFLKP